MPTGDFVPCVSCGRSYTWMGYFSNCPWCGASLNTFNPDIQQFDLSSFKFNVLPETKMRKYLPTLAELIDRLTIVQQKELKIPQNREEYTQELQDLMHDIKIC